MNLCRNSQLSALLISISLLASSHPSFARQTELPFDGHNVAIEDLDFETPLETSIIDSWSDQQSDLPVGGKIRDLNRLNLPDANAAEKFALETVEDYKTSYGHLDRSEQPPIFLYHIADENHDLPDQIKWILVYLESHKIPYQVKLTTPDEIYDEMAEAMNEASNADAEKLQLHYVDYSEKDINERKTMLQRTLTSLRRFFWIPKNVTFWLKAHPPKWTKFMERLRGKQPVEGVNPTAEYSQLPIWTEAKLKEQDANKLKAYVTMATATGMFNVSMSIINNPDEFLAHPSVEGFALGLMLVGARTYFTSTHNLWFDRIFTLGKDVRIAGNGEITVGLKGKSFTDKVKALGTKDFYKKAKSEFFKKTISVESHWRWNWLSNSFDMMMFNFFYFWTLYGISSATDPVFFQHAATNTLWYLLGRSWIDRKIAQKQATVHHNGEVELKPGQHSAGFTLLIKYVTKSIFGFFKTFDLMRPKDGDYKLADGSESNYKMATQIYRASAALGFTKILYDQRFWVMNKFKKASDWWNNVETPISHCTTYLVRPRAQEVQQTLFHD
jgi:hypothetical protein